MENTTGTLVIDNKSNSLILQGNSQNLPSFVELKGLTEYIVLHFQTPDENNQKTTNLKDVIGFVIGFSILFIVLIVACIVVICHAKKAPKVPGTPSFEEVNKELIDQMIKNEVDAEDDHCQLVEIV